MDTSFFENFDNKSPFPIRNIYTRYWYRITTPISPAAIHNVANVERVDVLLVARRQTAVQPRQQAKQLHGAGMCTHGATLCDVAPWVGCGGADGCRKNGAVCDTLFPTKLKCLETVNDEKAATRLHSSFSAAPVLLNTSGSAKLCISLQNGDKRKFSRPKHVTLYGSRDKKAKDTARDASWTGWTKIEDIKYLFNNEDDVSDSEQEQCQNVGDVTGYKTLALDVENTGRLSSHNHLILMNLKLNLNGTNVWSSAPRETWYSPGTEHPARPLSYAFGIHGACSDASKKTESACLANKNTWGAGACYNTTYNVKYPSVPQGDCIAARDLGYAYDWIKH